MSKPPDDITIVEDRHSVFWLPTDAVAGIAIFLAALVACFELL